jgi:hypothetical protein
VLLRGDADEIQTLLRSMKQDVEATERDIAQLVFYLNGGLNFVDAYELTTSDLNRLSKVVSDHFEKQNEAMKGTKR